MAKCSFQGHDGRFLSAAAVSQEPSHVCQFAIWSQTIVSTLSEKIESPDLKRNLSPKPKSEKFELHIHREIWVLHDCPNASFVPTTTTRLCPSIDLIFLPSVPLLVTILTWHGIEEWIWEGGWVGGGQMEWGRRACHRQRITPIPHSLWPTLAGHFPNLAPTFYAASPHNFLPGSTKLHMLSCNSTYFRWVGRICREIKPTGLRSSSFQSLVVESERLSFPTTGNWQTMEKQAAMNWQ